MDPASLVGAATSAAKGAWEIYNFCHDARHVNQVIAGLGREAKGLGDSCELVAKRLECVFQDSSSDKPSVRMQTQLETHITDCKETIEQLNLSLQGLDSGSLNFFKQMRAQIKLNLRTTDIAEARNRLRSHMSSLQLVLQVLSIETSYLVPQRADQHLWTLVGRVEQLIKDLQKPAGDADDHTDHGIIAFSKDAVTSAESLYNDSVANGSIGPPLTDEQIREIEGWRDESTDSTLRPTSDVSHDTVSCSSGDQTLVEDEDRASGKRRFKKSVDMSLQLALAKIALDASLDAWAHQNFAECLCHLQERSKIVASLPEEDVIRCNDEESAFRSQLAQEGLRAAEKSFTQGTFAQCEQQFSEASQLMEPLAEDLQSQYRAAETEIRMQIASEALQSVRHHFDQSDIETCWTLLRARSDIVKALGEAERAECHVEELDFRLQIAHSLLNSATAAEAQNDHVKCLQHLQLRDAFLHPLSPKQTAHCDTLQPLFLTTMCKCMTAKADHKAQDEASTQLSKATATYESSLEDLTDQQCLNYYKLCHILSQMYYRKAAFDDAEDYCAVALSGWRTKLGPDVEAAACSLALMSKILERKGEHRHAAYHRQLIPEAHKDSPGVLNLLSLEPKSVRFEERPPAEKTPQEMALVAKRVSASIVSGIQMAQNATLAASASMPVLVTHHDIAAMPADTAQDQAVQQASNSNSVLVASSPKSQAVPRNSQVAVVTMVPQTIERSCQVEFHTSYGKVTVKKFVPSAHWIASAEERQKVEKKALKRWKGLVETSLAVEATSHKGFFSKHSQRVNQCSYTPKLDLSLFRLSDTGTPSAIIMLNISPDHVRLLSSDGLQYAHIAGGDIVNKVLKKIDSAANPFFAKNAKTVAVLRIEVRYE